MAPALAWHGMPEMIHTNIRTFFADTSCLELPQCFCSDVTGVDGMDGWMDSSGLSRLNPDAPPL